MNNQYRVANRENGEVVEEKLTLVEARQLLQDQDGIEAETGVWVEDYYGIYKGNNLVK